MLDALQHYYSADNANIHRAVHLLSERATQAYEEARVKVKGFLRAADEREIIFVRGATEGINLVAQTFGRKNVREGDEVLITAMEHHSNIVPWQMLCEEKGATLRVAPIDDAGELLLDEFEKLLTPRTRIASVAHVSNALGTINPIKRIVEMAHARGVPVLVDGAQSAPHLPVNVRELGCDFFVFSGHKLFGPTGVGVLYGRETLLEAMPPWQGGGDMIRTVSFEKTTYNALPYKFEAGTPNIAGRHRPGGGDRLPPGPRLGRRRGLRGHAAAPRHGAAAANPRRAHSRRGRPQGGRDLVRRRGAARLDARRGREARPRRDRGSHGAPLLPAADGPLRRGRNGAGVVRPVQHRGGSGPARGRPARDHRRRRGRREAFLSRAAAVAPDYPAAAAASPRAAAEELAEVFDFLDDWPQRYQYLLELGEGLPPLPEAYRTEANRVHGCQATVHLDTRERPGAAGVIEFLANANADIVNGLIAVLERLFSGQKASEVVAFDVKGFFARIGLDHHLTQPRQVGLASMVERIRKFAAALAPGEVA